jgi:hypothetical protein
MATRDELHRLIDQLPADKLEQAKGFLLALGSLPPGPPTPPGPTPLTWQGDAPPLTMG